MLVSVVIPTRDRAEMLRELLRSFRHQTLDASDFEVIVVDDASGDETPEILRRETEDAPYALRVVTHEGPAGAAAARNTGWRAGRADLVAFTDDDCVATPGWLAGLVESARDNPGAIIQGLTDVPPDQADSVGPSSRVLQISQPGPFFATCNLLYPRALLERVGGFDETYPVGEDTDLGWRARASGAGYVFTPKAVIHRTVIELGLIGKLRWAFHWSDAMRNLADHPGLRGALTWRIFWKRSHALLALCVAGLLLARRFPPAALLALPYLRILRGRCIADGVSIAFMPYLALYDLSEVLAAARGGARHRVLVI